MVIDVHCHLGLSGRRADDALPRFSFEPAGASAHSGFDAYFSPRLLGRFAWRIIRRWMGIPSGLPPGDALDAQIEAAGDRHWSPQAAPGVDRLVLLAFDEYHGDNGRPIGPVHGRRERGSDLYVSNTLVRSVCAARPDRFLFGASIHPYRQFDGREAAQLVDEVADAGAVLVKWLPIHQNIRAEDPRTIAFLRRAAERRVAMLIHYGGEMSLARQHMEFESPEPMLGVLRGLRSEGRMPTVIVAHAATPSFRWQSDRGHRALVQALLGEFADAPLYADISALWALGRSHWLTRLAARRELHRKLVFGSDFPIPVRLWPYRRLLGPARTMLAAEASWVERSVRLARMLGFDDCVFTGAAGILRVR